MVSLRVLVFVIVCSIGTTYFVSSSASNPRQEIKPIQGFGKVVRLPDAVEQPRDGSKLCVDLTKGGEPDQLNSGLEKVARFVNIYAAAGKEPRSCQIIVVLHGGATAVALNDSAYREHFSVDHNPNAELTAKLAEAGVEFVVCGQSMTASGYDLQQVDPHVEIAVSALTTNVNRQADGFAFIPLH